MVGFRSSYLRTLCWANGNSNVLTRVSVVHCFSLNRPMEFILEIPFSAKYLASFLFCKCLNILSLNIVITNRLNNYCIFGVIFFLAQMIYDAFFSLEIHKSWMLKLKQKPIKKRSCTPNNGHRQLHLIKDFLWKSEQCKWSQVD